MMALKSIPVVALWIGLLACAGCKKEPAAPTLPTQADLRRLVAVLPFKVARGFTAAEGFTAPALVSAPLPPADAIGLWSKVSVQKAKFVFAPVLVPAKPWPPARVDPASVAAELKVAMAQDAKSVLDRRARKLAAFWKRLAAENEGRSDEDLDNYANLDAERKKLLAGDGWTVEADRGPPKFLFTQKKEVMEAVNRELQKIPDNALRIITEGMHDQVRLLVLGVQPDHVTAHLGFGCFNDCPCPRDQIPVLAGWRERHGARLIFVDRDVLEFWLDRPPTDSDLVFPLAWEHYLFCNDVVDQGAGSIEDLADELAGSNHWVFWWD